MTEGQMILIIWFMVGGLVGLAIEKTKGREAAGLLWGAALGILGWAVIAAGPNMLPKCPECGGVVVEGANKCKNCGSELASS